MLDLGVVTSDISNKSSPIRLCVVPRTLALSTESFLIRLKVHCLYSLLSASLFLPLTSALFWCNFVGLFRSIHFAIGPLYCSLSKFQFPGASAVILLPYLLCFSAAADIFKRQEMQVFLERLLKTYWSFLFRHGPRAEMGTGYHGNV